LRPGSVGSSERIHLALVGVAANGLVADVRRRRRAARNQRIAHEAARPDAHRGGIDEECKGPCRADVEGNQVSLLGIGRQQSFLSVPGFAVEIVQSFLRLGTAYGERGECQRERAKAAQTAQVKSLARESRTAG